MGCGGSSETKENNSKNNNQQQKNEQKEKSSEPIAAPAPAATAAPSIPKGSKVLVVTASGRSAESSASKKLANQLSALFAKNYAATVTVRDVSDGSLPFVDDAMIDSYFAQGERTEEQQKAVEKSDELVAELQANDVYIFAMPIYNFAAPASFKAYCDLVARAGMTFKYGEDGNPVGLLNGKKAYTIITSGGVPLESDMDKNTPWLKLFLGFIGISNVTTIDATKGKAEAAEKQIEEIGAAPAPRVLVVTASGRTSESSGSKKLASRLSDRLRETKNAVVTVRDVSDGSLPFVDDAMIDSYFAQGERTEEQQKAVEKSDELVAELQANDVYIFAMPIYNFAAPASFKAYCDLVARAGMTFKYGEDGNPVGLLNGKKAYTIITSGGVPLESDMDKNTPWLKLFLGFIGISDVTTIDATKGKAEAAEKEIDAI